MKIKTVDFTLPDYLAPYLINGDIDGLSENEMNEVDYFIINNKLSTCVSCTDYPEFRWRNDLNNLGGDCLIYTFII